MKTLASPSDNISKRNRLERVRGKLMNERAAFDKHWQELADFILPRRARFQADDTNQDNTRRSTKIIDSTATRAARTLRSGMHSGITSPARPWFKLSTPDPELAAFAPVKSWLFTVTERMATAFIKSNLYNVLPTLYGDMGVFATSAMAVLDDDHELLRSYPYPTGSYALGVSRRQIVDTFAMEYKMTVRQIVEEFGTIEGSKDIDWSGISTAVRNLWDKGNTETNIAVCWMIAPNLDADPDQIEARFKPWTSTYWEKAGQQGVFLRDSGFDEFPILAPRWEVTGFDWYGSDCPGMSCLSDIKALQIMQRRKAQAVELGINPSLQGPSSLQNKKVSLRAGEITYIDNLQAGSHMMLKPIRDVNLMALRFFTADIQDMRVGINETFFKDLFLMLAQTDRRQITAREVAERHEEKLLALGPVLERTNDELLDPLVDRTYAMMDRAGLIPPPPQELEGIKLKVEYTSLMAQAQKLVGVVGVDRFLQSTVPLIPTFPIIRHKIRASAIVDEYGELLGVNPKFIVSDEDAQKAMQAEAEQQAKAQQAAQAEQMSKTAKNLSGSNLQDNNALKQVMDGVQAS